jgi:CopG family nickel-responsive transcriptional regulator
MIRNQLVEREWRQNRETLGTITVVYNHNARLLNKKLTDVQHKHHTDVLAATHVHLDEDLCGEMIMVRGPAKRITEIANLIRQQKGVLHSSLSMSGTGKSLE